MAIKMTKPSYVRRNFICEDLGISRTKFWRMLKNGEYPPPIELSTRYEAWPIEIHEEWKAQRNKQYAT